MNTNRTLALIVATSLLLAAAFASPIVDIAWAQLDGLLPVPGAHAYGAEQDIEANHPSQTLHRYCASEAVQRQDRCQENEPRFLPSSIFLSGNTDTQASPSQQLHSHCVSENRQRQANCGP